MKNPLVGVGGGGGGAGGTTEESGGGGGGGGGRGAGIDGVDWLLLVTSPPERQIMNMSLCVRKPTMWFPNRSDTNQPVQLQKQARSLKFWI